MTESSCIPIFRGALEPSVGAGSPSSAHGPLTLISGSSISTSMGYSRAPQKRRHIGELRQRSLQPPVVVRFCEAALLDEVRLPGQPLLLVLDLLASGEQFTGAVLQPPLPLAHLDCSPRKVRRAALSMTRLAAISRVVLRILTASMASLALNSGLWERRALTSGTTFQGKCPASVDNDESVEKDQASSQCHR
jgi:hypothetical protein